MGDMPEILYNLLAKGKAVLWSSQDKQSCKVSLLLNSTFLSFHDFHFIILCVSRKFIVADILLQKSPTFMCKGFCPSDPLGAGFNINWDTVNLTKLLKDLLKLVSILKL